MIDSTAWAVVGGFRAEGSKSTVSIAPSTERPRWTPTSTPSPVAVYCTADDLLPVACPNARRQLTDAEVVTLCVAQQAMGIPSDRRFLAAARKRLGHLFPVLPDQPGFHKRRGQLTESIDWLSAVIGRQVSRVP